MADVLANTLAATKLYFSLSALSAPLALTCDSDDNATPEDWKAGLTIPAKDTRQQTEVTTVPILT